MQDMKAYLKSNRKVIVDVVLLEEWYNLEFMYKDKNGNTYHEDELEFKEYYGG